MFKGRGGEGTVPESTVTQIDTSQFEKPVEKPLTQSISKLPYVVKSGDTFYGILNQFEISGRGANEVFLSLKPLGLPALFPGDSLVIGKDSTGRLKNLELLSRSKYRYQVTCSDSSIRAEKSSLAVSTHICLLNGVLETSLSEQIYQLGASDAITARFADIFAWDINFFLDPRKGDTFQILFEKKYAEGRFIGYGDILAARYLSGQKEFLAFGLRDSDGRVRYYDGSGKSVQKQFLKAPLSYSRISSGFTHKRKHPILGYYRPHLGIDYAAPTGTPVYAAADGKVIFSGRKGDYGNLVILSHGGVYETYYGHLHRITSNARTGNRVRQGDMIGTVGATGLATGPHLDYRMKRHGTFVNPSTIIMPSNSSVETARLEEFKGLKQSFSVMLNLRFPGRTGLHVLDVETPVSEEPVVNLVNRVSESRGDGSATGS